MASYLAGVVAWDGRSPERDLARMRHASPFRPIQHRSIAMGSAGLMVMASSEDGRAEAWESGGAGQRGMTVVADCRLDNADELRAALGCDRGAPDATLIGTGYRRWGRDLPNHLIGDYAFVLWDAGQEELFAARDPFGVQPLVYATTPSTLCIASGVEALLALPSTRREVSERAIVDYLLWDTRHPDCTFFREILKVPPGHSLVAKRGAVRLSRYFWPPSRLIHLPRTEEYYEEFRRLFRRSVKARLGTSAVIHVSGGVDSTSIISTADALIRDGEVSPALVRGGSAIHPGLSCDEEPYIRAVAAHVQIPVEVWDGTQSVNLDLEEPGLAAPGSRTVFSNGTRGDVLIAERIGARSLISGTGGDQLGKPTGVVHDLIANGRWLTALRYILFFPGADLGARAKRARFAVAPFLPRWLASAYRHLRPAERPCPSWLTFRAECTANEEGPKPEVVQFSSFVQQQRWRALHGAGLRLSIDASQRHAIRSGLEVRFPFLDRELATFVMAIPHRHWPPPFKGERIHRSALAGTLPRMVEARRTKAEFTVAVANRVQRASALIRDILSGPRWASEPFVDRAAVRGLLAKTDAQPADAGFQDWYGLWSVATLETWLRAINLYSAEPSS